MHGMDFRYSTRSTRCKNIFVLWLVERKTKNSTLYGLKYEVLISGILSRIIGLYGIWNIFGTYALIKKYLQILFIYIIFICGIQMSLWWILSAEGYEAVVGELCGCAAEHDVCHRGVQPDKEGFYCGSCAADGWLL